MRITHDQAIDAVQIVQALAEQAKTRNANALLLTAEVVAEIVALSDAIDANE